MQIVGFFRYRRSLMNSRPSITLAIAVACLCLPSDTVSASAQPVSANPTTQKTATDPYEQSIAQASKRFSIPASWIRAVITVESNWNARAVSSAGAIGLMQVMPDTYQELRRQHGLGADPFDPHSNIMAGAAYLKQMHKQFGKQGFLAAYNAGPGRYQKHLNGSPLPAETVAYVAKLEPLPDVNMQPERSRTQYIIDPAWAAAPLFVNASSSNKHRLLAALSPRSTGLFATGKPSAITQPD